VTQKQYERREKAENGDVILAAGEARRDSVGGTGSDMGLHE
jgi:hypothetical protein